jgi:ATP-dependent Clp protease adaptor protein ClpS
MARLRPGHQVFKRPTALVRSLWKAGIVPDTLERTDERTDMELDVTADLQQQALLDQPWVTIVWNDPVNLTTYVAWVFRTYFGYSKPEAKRLMWQVHNDGKAVVAKGTREEMERHVNAMHGFGLWATLQKEDE